MTASVHIGLTLPSFVHDVEVPLAVAIAADAHGVDAVFAYDHLFRVAANGSRRPAIECFALMSACAIEAPRITIGSLVVRATLRPPAVLAHAAATLARVAGAHRLIIGIGAGDSQSRAENIEFGIDFGTVAERIRVLAASVRAVSEQGLAVWVGGNSLAVREIVALGGAWNAWGADPATFAREAEIVRAVAPGAPITWGGLVVLGADDAAAHDKASRLGAPASALVGGPATVARGLHGYVDVGAEWLVLGPVDSSDPTNAALAAEVKEHLA